jgi:hypothetical protein
MHLSGFSMNGDLAGSPAGVELVAEDTSRPFCPTSGTLVTAYGGEADALGQSGQLFHRFLTPK